MHRRSEKQAVITPLIKKAELDRESFSNYRPISGLSFTSKFIERIVAYRVKQFIHEHSLLSPFQSAYRSGFSTESALIRLYNDLSIAKDNGRVSLVIQLDLSAAFDTVDHSILLRRLNARFGFDDKVLYWFSSYLSDRTQFVHISGTQSHSMQLECGVPQGSVLGPLLYTLYTTPLSDIIESYNLEHQIYADDTQLYISFNVSDISAYIYKIESCLFALQDWFNCNMLKLNPEKTNLFICGPRHLIRSLDLPGINICGEYVPSSSVINCLGVTLDPNLDFDSQISQVSRRAFYSLRCIYRIRPFISKDCAKMIVNSLILSRIDYCNSLYGGVTLGRLRKLQRIENCCARYVKRLPRYSHDISSEIKDLKWLPVSQKIIFKVCCFVHKCLFGSAPTYLCELIQPAASAGVSRSLRSQGAVLLHQPISKTSHCSAFSVVAPRVWNGLSENVRNIRDFKLFKLMLFKELFA